MSRGDFLALWREPINSKNTFSVFDHQNRNEPTNYRMHSTDILSPIQYNRLLTLWSLTALRTIRALGCTTVVSALAASAPAVLTRRGTERVQGDSQFAGRNRGALQHRNIKSMGELQRVRDSMRLHDSPIGDISVVIVMYEHITHEAVEEGAKMEIPTMTGRIRAMRSEVMWQKRPMRRGIEED